jgi:hypothetical protein
MGRGPSLVTAVPRLAPELEREGRAGTTVPIPGSDGVAEAAAGIARELGQVGARIGQMADQAAAREGTEAGRTAGLDPEFRTRGDGTIRGEAFDRAGRETALARTRVEIENDIESTALAHRADPTGLAKTLSSKLKGYLEGADPTLHPEIRTLFARGTMAAQRQATRELWSRQTAEQAGAVQAELERSLRTVHQQAFAAGLDPAADVSIAETIARLQGTLSRRGPDGARIVSPAQAEKLLAGAKEQVATARLYGAFDRLPDLEAKQRFIAQLDKDFAGSTGAAAVFDLPTYQAVRGHLEAELRKTAARARTADATLTNIVAEVARRATTGEPVRPEELAAVRARVATTGNPELSAALEDGIANLAFMQSFKVLALPEMQAGLQQMREQLAAAPATLADRGRTGRNLRAAESMLAKAEAEIKADPLGWDSRVGLADVVPIGQVLQPGAAQQPGALSGWGATRAAQAEEAAARHRLSRPVYLQPVERRQMARQFERGGQEGLAAVTMIREAFGDKAEAVLTEIGRDAPAGALLGRLALSGPMTPGILDAAEGLHLRTRDGYKSLAPPESKSRYEAQTVVRDALADAPAFMSSAMRVADAIYEVRAARAGKRDQFEPDIWKQALREALGENTGGDGRTYGGIVDLDSSWFGANRVVLPPTVPQDKARSIFAELRPDDLPDGGPRFQNGRALTRAELRGATYHTLAPGRYLVKTTGSTAGWATDARGQPYVLDLMAVLPAITRRRPDLR